MGVLIENYLVILYQNVEAAWNISVEREQQKPYYVTPILKDQIPDILVIHIGFNGIGFWQLRHDNWKHWKKM